MKKGDFGGESRAGCAGDVDDNIDNMHLGEILLRQLMSINIKQKYARAELQK